MRYFAGFALVASLALVWGYFEGYRLNVTPSLAKGIYRLSDKMPERGDIVSFCLSGAGAELAKEREYLQSGSCPSGLRPLLKRLAAMPADEVIQLQNGISCVSPDGLGCFWPVLAKKVDSQGRQVLPAVLSGIVPDGKALVLTLHDGSFDSRYFGYVPLNGMKKVVPILTF